MFLLTYLLTICQTIVQHCRTSDLELTATSSVELRLSLSLLSNPDLKLICFLLLFANYSACSASASVAAKRYHHYYYYYYLCVEMVDDMRRMMTDTETEPSQLHRSTHSHRQR